MNNDLTKLVTEIIFESSWHLETLRAVRELGLPDWAIGAGFVRNAVWDRLHGYHRPTPLADIDVLYFDSENLEPLREVEIEKQLFSILPSHPWSVRNQARMHIRNSDNPYSSTEDAMSFWLETPTCVAIRLEENDKLTVISPFGLTDLVEMRGSPTTAGRKKYDQYIKRMREKNWPHQ